MEISIEKSENFLVRFFTLLYSFKGKIGRLEYFLAGLGLILLNNLMGFIVGFNGLLFLHLFTKTDKLLATTEITHITMAIGYINAAIVTFAINIKRLRDIGWPPGYSAIMLIPIANLALVLILFFIKGEDSRELTNVNLRQQ